jgi:hypothetical protein
LPKNDRRTSSGGLPGEAITGSGVDKFQSNISGIEEVRRKYPGSYCGYGGAALRVSGPCRATEPEAWLKSSRLAARKAMRSRPRRIPVTFGLPLRRLDCAPKELISAAGADPGIMTGGIKPDA